MIKKAILTGGGRATRLRPITSTINKHLIKLAGKPMIWHAIEKVAKAGIEEIFINTNPGETELQEEIGDGSRWGVKITFFEQTGGPQGIPHVVKQAEKFIGEDPFMFYLSDNIVLADLNEFVNKFERENCDCMLALSKVKDPERFGIPYFDKQGNLVDTKEKPNNPPNNFAITGIYLFGAKSFFTAFGHIKKSARGEYEIPDIFSYLLKNGYKVGYQEITGWWKDTGKPEDLLLANALLMDQMDLGDKNYLVGEGTEIGENVEIDGPAIIGDNCILENCEIKPHVTIGNSCIIKQAKVGNSLLFDNCTIDCDIKIKDSILGKGAKVAKKQKDTASRLILGDNTLAEI
jgi:glucose-1-phosphate thymidylyltransferase